MTDSGYRYRICLGVPRCVSLFRDSTEFQTNFFSKRFEVSHLITISLFFLLFQVSLFSFDPLQSRWSTLILDDNVSNVHNDVFALEKLLDTWQNSIWNFDAVNDHKEGHDCQGKLLSTKNIFFVQSNWLEISKPGLS